MQHPLKEKLKTELKKDSRNFSWFYLKYLQNVTTLDYTTIMNQLDKKYPLNHKVETVINMLINLGLTDSFKKAYAEFIKENK